MRVLFDIVHPADVLFFKRPMEILRAKGDDLLVLSREKDIACDLLESFDIAHTPVSVAGAGLWGLARELIERDLAVFRHARRFRPDVMIGFGGVAVSHIGWLTGVPSISFYDSDNATLQNRIMRPFITKMYVPEAYSGRTPKGRTVRLKGTKDLSYLHPSAFHPDREKAIDAGLTTDQDNFFIRIVAWRANHDVGKAGWSEDLLSAVVSRLETLGKVHISSEVGLPRQFAQYAYSGRKQDVHHLLAHCRMMVGESATMACEAGLLGTPAIYAGRDFPAYTIEMERAGLIKTVRDATEPHLISAITEILGSPVEHTKTARDTYVAGRPDWAHAVVDAVREFKRDANSAPAKVQS